MLGLLVLTGGFGLVALGQGYWDRRAAAESQVTTIARAVAVATRARELSDDERVRALPQPFIEAIRGEAEEIVVVKGNKLLGHTQSARAGGALDPESLDDKVIFDVGGRMKALVGKNLEERERRPELTANPYPEVELSHEGGNVTVAIPVKRGDKYQAAVRVKAQPSPLPVGLPWAIFGGLLGAVVAFFGVSQVAKGKVELAAGALLLLGVAGLDTWALTSWRAEARGKEAEARAQLLLRLAPSLVPRLVAEEREALAATFDEAPEGTAARRVLAVRSSTVGAATISGGVRFSAGDYEVIYAGDALQKAAGQDQRNLLLWALGLFVVGAGLFVLGATGLLGRGVKAFIQHRSAYGYMAPAMLGMAVLVFIPVVYGLVLAFFDKRYNIWEFAGLSNFLAILANFDLSDPQSFYYKFAVTILWTATNVSLHVGIGLFLALLLNDPMLKAKGVFRVLLIVPWAIPNYITALIWKGMFHKQFGAVNFFLDALGMEPIAWFQDFWPAFFTNLATNTWLGFPFMMVVSLGALQSIPADLYEAAFVDGATRWQRFSKITLPLLKPALVPAVILGTVWTFNMFNVIYLVSGGAPNGATDILITDAFRWAFERDKYGYAAAYSTLIFLILLGFTAVTNRVTGATKGAFE